MRWGLPIGPPRKPGSTNAMRATRRWRRRVNSRPRPWRRSPNRRLRNPMIRVILFLVLIALVAAGAAWVADQSGDVVLSSGGWRIETTLPVFALALGVLTAAARAAV